MTSTPTIDDSPRRTEIIAFCSGKGGTGKSLLCSCFAYALIRGGQRVLVIDADPATDGLSLFVLGPEGSAQVSSFSEVNTFVGSLNSFKKTGAANFEPKVIHRRGESDHGISYEALISGRGIYGDKVFMGQIVPDLDQKTFRGAINSIFGQIRASAQYDYVLVDTRGGFAFESADICALADGFIVITEPDVTSYYQDCNLIASIQATANELESQTILRGIIVNKALDETPKDGTPYLDTLEISFRNRLVQQFKLEYKETYPVPVAIEVLMAYKIQKIPYVSTPESNFCLATLAAFSGILRVVTSRWTAEQVDNWNVLTNVVRVAVSKKLERVHEEMEAAQARSREFETIRKKLIDTEANLERLREDSAQKQLLFESERLRADALLSRFSSPAGIVAQSSAPDKRSLWRLASFAILAVSIGLVTFTVLYSRQKLDAERQELAYEQSVFRTTLKTPPLPASSNDNTTFEAPKPILQSPKNNLSVTPKPSQSQSVPLSTGHPSSVIGLNPAAPATVGTVLSKTALPACLAGMWKEVNGGDPFYWDFSLIKSNLHIQRADGFVEGDFNPSGLSWTGSLVWGNHDVWKNVTLTPSADCQKLATNQAWSYTR